MQQTVIDTVIKVTHKYTQLADWGIVKVSADQAGSFLQGQLTCDVMMVTHQQGTLGALCNHQGRVLAVFYLLKKANDYYCLLPRSLIVDFIEHLSKFAVFSKVRVENFTDHYFLYGCVGEATLPTQQYEVLQTDHSVILNLSGDNSRFLIWTDEPLACEKSTLDNASWKLLNIRLGQAIIYSETKGVVTPHMLNLHLLNAISFNKGCYVGQEIIARTHYLGKSKRHLCKAELAMNIDLLPGEMVIAKGQEVGVLLESVKMNSMTYLLAVIQEPIDRDLSIQGYVLRNVCYAAKETPSKVT